MNELPRCHRDLVINFYWALPSDAPGKEYQPNTSLAFLASRDQQYISIWNALRRKSRSTNHMEE